MPNRALVVFLCSLVASAEGLADERPNIVVILADDMGYGDPGCYNPNSKCPTPSIDQLAGEGLRLTDAHAAGSWCTPSRYGLLTGRYAYRTSLAWRKEAVVAEGVATIAEVLRNAGYATAMVGKWHLGFDHADQADLTKPLSGGPCDRGFTTFFGLPASLDIPDYYWIVNRSVPNPPSIPIQDSTSPGWSAVQGRFWRGGLRGEDFVMEQVLDRIGQEASKRIAALSQTSEPFFLYVPLTSPHTPWLPSTSHLGADQAGLYSQFVHHTDAIVGQIMDSLDKQKVSDNTIIVFTSDNGPVWYRYDTERFGHDSTGGLRGMKGDVWEAGHRVPMVVRWPKKIPAGTVGDYLFSLIDLHATLASIAATSSAPTAVDSISFADVWLGNSTEAPRQELVCFQDPIALRSGDWKLITRPGSSGFLSHDPKQPFLTRDALNPELKGGQAPTGQLYDLSRDRAETRNLWDEKQDVVERLQSRLTELTR